MNNQQSTPKSHYIHRTTYSIQEKLVGMFVISAAIILLVLLSSVPKKQNIFEDYIVIYGRLSTAAGLSTDTTVQVMGFEAGTVTNIEITDDNDIRVTLSIAEKYHNLIRSDSVVKVSSLSETAIGRSIIEITAGSPKMEQVPAGAELKIKEAASIDTVMSNISDIVNSIEPESIKQTVASTNNITRKFSAMSDHMGAGKGGLGSLIYDKKLEKELAKAISNLHKSSANLDAIMKKLENNSSDVPVVIDEVQTVIEETRKTIEATQRVWPISSAVAKPKDKPLLLDPMPAND
ncbi:MAG: MlaD family protein [Gammaproteobacteria bacterium]|nr:MlaD family protein [Gammaproteobacteria bacterium]